MTADFIENKKILIFVPPSIKWIKTEMCSGDGKGRANLSAEGPIIFGVSLGNVQLIKHFPTKINRKGHLHNLKTVPP